MTGSTDPEQGKILVAEDDANSFLYLEAVLEAAGYQLTHCTNGKDAVEEIKQNPDYSLILMDIKMPELNGLDATKEIRTFNANIPIIAQTAYALSGDYEMAIDAGFNDYITKPIKRNLLLDIIKKYL
ncbi:response regulator [Geofilum sp. OHC36d9]|uniref:response regulator n=1 Tax=Geofilum sp. OHC36d9 TaxID=3458413 RepID=UPI004034E832